MKTALAEPAPPPRTWRSLCHSPFLGMAYCLETGMVIVALAAPSGNGFYTGTPQAIACVTDAGCGCGSQVCMHQAALAVLRQRGLQPDADPWSEHMETTYADAGGVTARISWDTVEGSFAAILEVRNGFLVGSLGTSLAEFPMRRFGLDRTGARMKCSCGSPRCMHLELYQRAFYLGWRPLNFDLKAAIVALEAAVLQRTELSLGSADYVLDSKSVRGMRERDGRRTWLAAIAIDRKAPARGLLVTIEAQEEVMGPARVQAAGGALGFKARISTDAAALARRGYREILW